LTKGRRISEKGYKHITRLYGDIAVKTLAIISQKGGSGKTTLAVHMAVCAARHGQETALIDIDEQGSLHDWNESRDAGRKFEAAKATAGQLPELLQKADAAGMDLSIIDTAPHAHADAAIAAQLADFVLIPCRPARFDLKAIASTIVMVRAAKKPHAVVINAAPHGFRLVEEARAALEQLGVVVLPDVVHQFADLSHAVIDGRSVHEYEPEGTAASEIDKLYDHITGLYGDMTRKQAAA
jgi:chromosome partitioning protein